jgi:Rhs element Vgr protein
MSLHARADAAWHDALRLPFLTQQARLLRLELRRAGAPLVPEQALVREAVNQPFEITVDALSPDTALPLREWLGTPATLRLVGPDGGLRPWHALVAAASHLGADEGLARYRLVLVPWLRLLEQRCDAHAFQDRTALEIVEEVFADYPMAHWQVAVTEPLRRRSLCIQYRETDFEFVTRLLAEEGLSYHFEHLDGEALEDAAHRGQAGHVMVITDRAAPRRHLGPLRYARADVRVGARPVDGITAFAARHAVGPNAVTLGAWDYKQLAGIAAQAASAPGEAELPLLEVYDGAGQYRYQDRTQAARAAALALEALELDGLRFDGEGAARVLAAGVQFELHDHPMLDRCYTVLAVEHEIRNHLGESPADRPGPPGLEPGSYRNRFACCLATTPVVPLPRRKPTAPGCQTALVVGVSGEPLTTDRDLRVKLQFPWQRGVHPNPGGLHHDSPGDPTGNAPGNEQSGTWVRVTVPWAGANWGAAFVPRVGTEVLVEFTEGDIDRPVIAGQLYNGEHLPPYAAGEGSGVNHPGVISGLYSHALDGEGSNTWVIDDTTGQLRMRFLATQAMSELGLGHLIQQGTHGAHRGPWRGSGFELATRGWASIRAAEGLLVTTTARPQQGASVSGTQMDAAESLGQLKAAHALGQRLDETARGHQALGLASHDPDEAFEHVIRQIDPTRDGRYTGPVNGQVPAQARPGSREPGDPVERFAEPLVLMDTPAAAAFTTPATLASFAAQDQSLAVQSDLHEAAAHTASSVSGRTTSLFAHDGGIQAVAAHGPVSLRAHTDQLALYADQEVRVVSVHDEIHIQARERIEIVGGESRLTLAGSDITFACPGTFTVQSAGHHWEGPAHHSVQLPTLPRAVNAPLPPHNPLFTSYDEQVVFKDALGFPINGRLRYAVVNMADTTQSVEGDTLIRGEVERMETPEAHPLETRLRYARFRFDA